MTEYYHLINGQAHGLFLTQQSMGGNEYGKSGPLSVSTSLKHFLMLSKCSFFFQGFILHLTKDTDSMYMYNGNRAQILSNVEAVI